MAVMLLGGVKPGTTLLSDEAYDTDAIRKLAKQRKCWANALAKVYRGQTFGFS